MTNPHSLTEVEVAPLPCPLCGTEMHRHKHCFSHPKPSEGDCLLRHYSFDNHLIEQWNTRSTSAQPSTEAVKLADELAEMATGLRGSMWANRNEIIALLDRGAAALRGGGHD